MRIEDSHVRLSLDFGRARYWSGGGFGFEGRTTTLRERVGFCQLATDGEFGGRWGFASRLGAAIDLLVGNLCGGLFNSCDTVRRSSGLR